MKNLPKGETNKQYRLSIGLPVGCRNCGSDECKISGVCKKCEEKRFHKPLRKYSKELGKTIFELNKEELLSYHEKNKMNVE
jgi:predicted ATP-dependent serine protease